MGPVLRIGITVYYFEKKGVYKIDMYSLVSVVL